MKYLILVLILICNIASAGNITVTTGSSGLIVTPTNFIAANSIVIASTVPANGYVTTVSGTVSGISLVKTGTNIAISGTAIIAAAGVKLTPRCMVTGTQQGYSIPEQPHFTNLPAWGAFDGYSVGPVTGEYGWLNNSGTTGTLVVQLPTAQVATSVVLVGWTGASTSARCPKNFTIDGSNNGASWTNILTQTSVTSWTGVNLVHNYTLSNITLYTYYRLNITDNNGDAYTGLRQLEFY